MVFFTLKPSRVLAACCRVDVMKGAAGLELVGLSSRLLTCRGCWRNKARALLVSASLVGRNSAPLWRVICNRRASPAGVAVAAKASQYSSGINARISRSRSTIRRTATDCTRPADKPRATLAHSRGDTIKPTTRSRKRRVCWALTRFIFSSDGCSKAC